MLELEVASKDAAGFLNVSSSNCHPSALKQVDPLADVRSCPWDEALEAALRVTLGTLIVSLGFPYVINIRSTSLCNGRYFDRVFVALKMGKDTYDLKEVFIRKLRNLRDKLHRPSSMLVYVLCLFIGSYGGLRKAIKVFFCVGQRIPANWSQNIVERVGILEIRLGVEFLRHKSVEHKRYVRRIRSRLLGADRGRITLVVQ